MVIKRGAEHTIIELLHENPVVAVVGPRQCGKTTLAKMVLKRFRAVYLDLELPSDVRKLTVAEQFFLQHNDALICIDEVQRKPELFPLIRAVVDRSDVSGQFLLLGSASPELLRQSSESLAGRIAYFETK